MSDEQDPRKSTEVKRIRDSDTNPYVGLHSPESTPCVEDVYCSIADEDVVLPSKKCKSVLPTHHVDGDNSEHVPIRTYGTRSSHSAGTSGRIMEGRAINSCL